MTIACLMGISRTSSETEFDLSAGFVRKINNRQKQMYQKKQILLNEISL